MTLSREEIAVRVLCALAQDPTFDASEGVPRAVRISDRLLAALTPTPVPPVDPVREAERAVVEAADAWTVAYDKNDYPDSGHSERIRLSDAIDALRAARKARGGAS